MKLHRMDRCMTVKMKGFAEFLSTSLYQLESLSRGEVTLLFLANDVAFSVVQLQSSPVPVGTWAPWWHGTIPFRASSSVPGSRHCAHLQMATLHFKSCAYAFPQGFQPTMAYPFPNIDVQSHCRQATVLPHQQMCCSTICQIEQCGGSDGDASVLAALPSCCRWWIRNFTCLGRTIIQQPWLIQEERSQPNGCTWQVL